MKFNYYILAGALFLFAPIKAQKQAKDTTHIRTVVVEQEYNPTLMDASKVNVLPPVEEPQVTKKEVVYDTKFSPSYMFPKTSIEPFMAKEIFKKGKPGYFRFGYGNYGNVDSRVNYLFTISPQDQLNLDFSLMGMNGELDLFNGKKWDARYYKTNAGINYQHQFTGANLKLGGNFGLSNFNYHNEHLVGFKDAIIVPRAIADKQKFTRGSFLVGVETTNSELPLQADVNMKFSHYARQNDWMDQTATKENIEANKESKLQTSADVFAPINEDSRIGVFFNMNNFFYSSDSIENHTTVDFNPYYEYQDDHWKMRLGAHVDLAFNFGKSVNVAPDVNIAYLFSDSYMLYVTTTGGRQVNDFQQMERINPYAVLSRRLEDTYEQVNASIGFKASPTAGLWLNLFGGYQNLKKDIFQHNEWLTPTLSDNSLYNWEDLGQTNSNNVFAGATVSYSYKNLVDLTLSGVYRNWSVDNDLALLMKPLFDLDFRTVFRPISSLDIELGYRYIHRTESNLMKRFDPVSNLHAEVTYRLYKGASIYVKADNILNQDYQYFYSYPTQGFNFVGGVKFLF
ncbi:MAG: TonB-dependent receptor [Bacteroidales bacterium]|nr:TonB-dependent receptor [Bacteroidales bacterium]